MLSVGLFNILFDKSFLATAAAGMGGDDDSSVARMIAMITGVSLPKKSTES